MSEGPSEAVILAWVRLVKAARLVLAAVETDLKKAGFPPLGWYDVLLELRRANKPLRPVEIEGSLLIAQHNVSRLLDRLEVAGYVERSPCEDDGRGRMVTLSDAGRALLLQMWPAYRTAIARNMGEKISEIDSENLGRILRALID